MLNRKLQNKHQRQCARFTKTERLLLTKFLHTLNNKLCAIQGTTQLCSIQEPLDKQHITNSIDRIDKAVFNIVDSMNNLQIALFHNGNSQFL